MSSWKTLDAEGFDAELADTLAARGFVDASWGNDSWPGHFIDEARFFSVWIDYANAEQKENPDEPYRFVLDAVDPNDEQVGEAIGAANNVAGLVALLDSSAPELWEQFTDHDFREFATRNFTRYMDLWNDDKLERDPTPEDIAAAGIVELSDDDQFVVDPYLSGCARFAVDPVETYGQKLFDGWKLKAAIQMAAGK